MHLREDRRHIIDRDPFTFMALMQTQLNLEMAVTPEMLAIAQRMRPSDCCLVPERRSEVTTEGGLDVASQQAQLQDAVAELRGRRHPRVAVHRSGCGADQGARAVGAPVIELHTGAYAEASGAGRGARAGTAAQCGARRLRSWASPCMPAMGSTTTMCSRWRPCPRSSN